MSNVTTLDLIHACRGEKLCNGADRSRPSPMTWPVTSRPSMLSARSLVRRAPRAVRSLAQPLRPLCSRVPLLSGLGAVASPVVLTQFHARPSSSAAAPPVLASPEDIRSVRSRAVMIDLRGPDERAEHPGPTDSVVWDWNADPTVPIALLPADKATPIVLY